MPAPCIGVVRYFLVLPLCLASSAVAGQSLPTPSSHWGTFMLPEREPREEHGLHFIGFTEYGKDVDSTGAYIFRSYADSVETLGFNLYSITCTDALQQGTNPLIACPDQLLPFVANIPGIRRLVRWAFEPRKGDEQAPAVSGNPLIRRRNLTFGIIDDNIPRFLQNEVIHRGNLRDVDLREVPRAPGDVDGDVSLGRQHLWPPVIQLSDEYFVRLAIQRTERIGKGFQEIRTPTPMFVGGGFSVGTLNHEAFVHVGSHIMEWDWDAMVRGTGVRSLGVGGIYRAGVLMPSCYFDDLTAGYTLMQGVARARVEVAAFPLTFDLALTQSRGFFVQPRTEAQRALIEERDEPMAAVYEAKSPADERFISLRLRIGVWTFETYNDFVGGKDAGPSFGAHMTWAPPLSGRSREAAVARAFQ